MSLTQIQCAWTPEVKTPIFSSERGTVALRTFHGFHRPPAHPANLSHPLLYDIFNGLRHHQEAGILQELFSSSSDKPSPVFSQAQIDFLVPRLSLALAQSTTEELVDFACAAIEPSENLINGSIGVFDSQILFLTMEISKHPSGSPSSRSSKGNAFRGVVILGFQKPEAIIPRSRIQPLLDLPRHPQWLALDFGTLLSGQALDEALTSPTNPPVKSLESPTEVDPRIERLEKKMDRLLETIEEQHKEIQRLQGTTP